MNNKGQSLVLFIFLIPLFIGIFAYIFDTCYIKINNSKLDNITYMAISYVLKDKDKTEVEQLILDNDSDIKVVNITDNEVHLKKRVDSIFGAIIGIKSYNIDSIYKGYIDSNNIIRIKKG